MYQTFFDAAFARRPKEELYDLKVDADQTHSVADDPDYTAIKTKLADRLMSVLKATGDPRVAEGVSVFDQPPFTDASEPPAKQKKK